MAFVYLLLSLVVSGISEIIAQWFSLRSKNLETWINQVFEDPSLFYGHPLIKGLAKGTNKPSYVPASTFALVLNGVDLASSPEAKLLTDSLRDPDSVQETLKNMEHWFDGAMDRVSGWYKRRAQYILLAIGIILAASLNVDSFDIADRLWRDDAVRSSVVAAAEQLPAQQESLEPNAAKSLGDIADEIDEIEQLGIPIGWDKWPDTSKGQAAKIGGIAFTAVALSLGAPFWFGAVNKLVGLRTSIKPKTSKEEAA